MPNTYAAHKLSGIKEAILVATAISSTPAGHDRWTLELLADAMVRLTQHVSLSRDTVRRRLAENELKPWREKMWCVPQLDGEFVARMEDVLDLYAEPPDPKCPVVCLDESPLQLIGETRQPIPAAPGQVARADYEYRRCGTVNLFVVLDVHRPWRRVTVTERRTAQDYAARLRALVDVDYPQAARSRVVQDNQSTHTPRALYAAFPAAEARRNLRRLEFHYTPKHASWLNMVEIEIGVLKQQCLDRRIETRARLEAEIATWEHDRNASGARISWMFTTEKARAKMGRAYQKLAASPDPAQAADPPAKPSKPLRPGTTRSSFFAATCQRSPPTFASPKLWMRAGPSLRGASLTSERTGWTRQASSSSFGSRAARFRTGPVLSSSARSPSLAMS